VSAPPAIHLDGVGKRYRKLDDRPMLLSALVPRRRTRTSDLWAVRGVDLRVDPGETLGVLGRNGSGKTTLLRMLCGVTSPTEGRVRVSGRLAPLIGVGAGFHQEMSGRDNVFVNGLLLGLDHADIVDRFDAIVDFAELREFIDTPVKFYSSGMFVRLGFSVAVHCEPEILLVDEVLAVGDLAYQLKCVERMRQLQDGGCTIVLVSHSLAAIRALCPRTILMSSGRIEHDGATEEAIGRYHDLLSSSADAHEAARSGDGRLVVGGARMVSRELRVNGSAGSYARPGDRIELHAEVAFDTDVESPLFAVNVLGADGRAAYGIHSPVGLVHRDFAAGSRAEVVFKLVNHLAGGSYRITTSITSTDGRQVLASDSKGDIFFVEGELSTYGVADLEGSVHVDGVHLAEDREFRLGRSTGQSHA
jgi:ABC-type polysaccharide/polyol phosphate transport system ATPase subunit